MSHDWIALRIRNHVIKPEWLCWQSVSFSPRMIKSRETVGKLPFVPSLFNTASCLHREFVAIKSHAALFAPEFISRPSTDRNANPAICYLGDSGDVQQINARRALGRVRSARWVSSNDSITQGSENQTEKEGGHGDPWDEQSIPTAETAEGDQRYDLDLCCWRQADPLAD